MEIKKNISLLAGIAIPVFMILFVAISVYVPQLFVRERPTHDFVYIIDGRPYSNCYNYTVVNGKLSLTPYSAYPECKGEATSDELFVYDMKEGKSKLISVEDAKKLALTSNPVAPDGFTIQSGSRNDGIFPFFFYSSPDYRTVYVRGHGITKKLNIEMGGNYYDYGYLKFIGWVVPSAQ